MPTAPKTYHDQHFKHLTYLLLFICHTLPTLNPSHPAALPDAQHLPALNPLKKQTETKKDQKQASHRRDGKARPHPARSPPEPSPPTRPAEHKRNCEPNIPGRALQGVGRDATRLAGAGLRNRKGKTGDNNEHSNEEYYERKL